jgi:hypothetical protein
MYYYKFFKVVLRKQDIKRQYLSMKTYELTHKFIYLHKLKNKLNPNRAIVILVIMFINSILQS